MNPDCRDGKHASCSGDGWDEDADRPRPCPCICHARGEQVISFVQEVLHIELNPWQKHVLLELANHKTGTHHESRSLQVRDPRR